MTTSSGLLSVVVVFFELLLGELLYWLLPVWLLAVLPRPDPPGAVNALTRRLKACHKNGKIGLNRIKNNINY